MRILPFVIAASIIAAPGSVAARTWQRGRVSFGSIRGGGLVVVSIQKEEARIASGPFTTLLSSGLMVSALLVPMPGGAGEELPHHSL